MKRYQLLCKAICVFCFYVPFTTAYSQPALCPVNIDFELGDFTNWECYTGFVSAISMQNTIQWDNISSTPTQDRMEMIGPTDNSVDGIGGFPRHCPNSSGYSIKLGNSSGGHQAEGVSYTYAIPATATKFSILYNYAIVLQAPNHLAPQQPRFRARIIDVGTGNEIDCVSFDFTSSGSLPGFQSAGDIIYKDWTPVSVDLSSFAGRTVRLEFITSDCTFDAHFGYAYIDVNSYCNGNIKGSTICDGDTAITLTAPYGYESYAWYADATFGQVVHNGQQFSPNIATAVGAVYPVIVNPYSGFGCIDTLYALITTAANPDAVAGADRLVCNKQGAQIGGPPNMYYTYSWTPAHLLQNATLSNPRTVVPFTEPARLILKTTDIATGCLAYDTVVLTPTFVDTASTFFGKLGYCPGEPLQTTLRVENAGVQVQWLKESLPLPGSTSHVLRPGTTGSYKAVVSQNGCFDTTRSFNVRYVAVPKANFTLNKVFQCINQPIAYSNKTTIDGNEAVAYEWRFSDGTTVQTKDIEKAFAAAGMQTATLIARTGANCADSISKSINITTFCRPLLPTAFTPNADGLNDRFTPHLAGAKALKQFSIYNRYGSPVFITKKEGEGWNGTYRGMLVEAGVYVWMLEYTDAGNKAIAEKGTVTVIR